MLKAFSLGDQNPQSSHNPFTDRVVAASYEGWYSGPGRRADLLEKQLLQKLRAEFPQSRTALEIGCGTGHFTRWLGANGLQVTGLDSSAAMLSEARKFNGLDYLEGDAASLPLGSRSFDLTLLITTLEFVEDPVLVLTEAVRVARQGVILGVLNRWSWLTMRYRLSGKSIWRSAHFFTPYELKDLMQRAAGERFQSLRWRTTLWPIPWVTDLPLPFGGFTGLAVHLTE